MFCQAAVPGGGREVVVEANLSFGFYKGIFFYFFGLLETTENGLKRKKNLTFFGGIFFFIFFLFRAPQKN